MLKILIAEDNNELRKLMAIHLERAGYEVLHASDGNSALVELEKAAVHLMIVDIMMPRMDGWELTKAVRDAKLDIPILMMTARGSLEDKKKGFSSGADDYLVKPVDMDEMLLHVQALLRRAKMAHQCVMQIGETMLDEEKMEVSWPGHTLFLRQKEFQLLHLLLTYTGKIFTRQALMDEIWGYDTETDPRTVDVHIKRLREKLVDNADFSIQTVRGLGYKAVTK